MVAGFRSGLDEFIVGLDRVGLRLEDPVDDRLDIGQVLWGWSDSWLGSRSIDAGGRSP
ncbi:MAG: hypothetical protein ACI9PP_001836 [Halobacteriales archaeon]